MIKKLDSEAFATFWDNFGTSIKLGVIEDSTNRNRLAKLLRFTSSNSEDLTSLEEYVERMKEKQDKIFFLGCNGLEECKRSPFTERLIKKEYEVLYLTEPVDEYAIQALPEFDGKRFQNVAKEGLDIDQSSKAKKQQEAYKTEFEPLINWLKNNGLKDRISDAVIAESVDSSPAVLVASAYGWSGNMKRIMEAQAYKTRADSSQDFYAKQKQKLGINPRHPLIKSLNERIQANEDDAEAKQNAQLMFDTAVLRSDFDIADKAEFAERILGVMYGSLGIDREASIDEEAADIDEDEEEAEEDEDADEIDADDEDDEEIEEPETEFVDSIDSEDSFDGKDEL